MTHDVTFIVNNYSLYASSSSGYRPIHLLTKHIPVVTPGSPPGIRHPPYIFSLQTLGVISSRTYKGEGGFNRCTPLTSFDPLRYTRIIFRALSWMFKKKCLLDMRKTAVFSTLSFKRISAKFIHVGSIPVLRIYIKIPSTEVENQ